jgi:hypothetical protein
VFTYFGQVFENYRSSSTFGANVYNGKNRILILTKSVLGYLLGDFFRDSSGHPATGLPDGFFSNQQS